MRRSFLLTYTVVILIADTMLLQILITQNDDYKIALYSIHTNRSLNCVSMANVTIGSKTECLLECLSVPSCMSLNVIKGTMGNDGKIKCHLFNVTHHSMALSLNMNVVVDHYTIAEITSFEDCQEAKSGKPIVGAYSLQERGGFQFKANCDMTTDGGGWTVIQKRFNGSVDFARPWVDYKNGFGDVNGEYWLGLDAIHELTNNGNLSLRVDMWDNSDYAYAVYSHVKISDENEGFRFNYEAMIDGTNMTTDSLEFSKGMKFSTLDRDNDKSGGSCSREKSYAGWWFNRCTKVNPNGAYTKPGPVLYPNSVYWMSFRGRLYSIEKIEMKLRRK